MLPPLGHPKDYDGTPPGARREACLAPGENPSTGEACPTDDSTVRSASVLWKPNNQHLYIRTL
jgi:hypothetical protein